MRLSNYDFEVYKRNDRKSMISAHNLAFMWYIGYEQEMYVMFYLMYIMFYLMYIMYVFSWYT